EAARSSGAPYPRLVDLPGATIVWDAELRTYLESDEALTSRDFPLEWAVGVLRASEDLFRVPRLHSSESQSRVHGVVRPAGGGARGGWRVHRRRVQEISGPGTRPRTAGRRRLRDRMGQGRADRSRPGRGQEPGGVAVLVAASRVWRGCPARAAAGRDPTGPRHG